MIDSRAALTVLKDTDGVFTDLTLDAADYLTDPFDFDLGENDTLYIALHKPFSTVFIEMAVPAESDVGLGAEYFDGESWQTLTLTDETRGLTRSGFLSWDKTKLEQTVVNDKGGFYVRLSADSEVSGTAIRGINIVYTGMPQLKQEFWEVDNEQLLPNNESSHIGIIVAARDQLIQQLRNMGYQKNSGNTKELINPFDLIDIFEVREASTFLTLSKLFFNLSSSPDDHWWQKYNSYKNKFTEMARLAYLSIDKNDDGVDDPNEKQAPIKVVRWRR